MFCLPYSKFQGVDGHVPLPLYGQYRCPALSLLARCLITRYYARLAKYFPDDGRRRVECYYIYNLYDEEIQVLQEIGYEIVHTHSRRTCADNLLPVVYYANCYGNI